MSDSNRRKVSPERVVKEYEAWAAAREKIGSIDALCKDLKISKARMYAILRERGILPKRKRQ